jgi:uncharacterized protein
MIELHVLEDTRRFTDGIDQSPCDGCDECGARCTEGVPMLRPEYEALRAYLESPEGADARRVEQQEKRLPFPGVEDVFYTACRFRDAERRRCSVYPVRPAICRMFGHVEWLPCPIGKVPHPAPRSWQAIRRYSEGIRKTYEEWEADPR